MISSMIIFSLFANFCSNSESAYITLGKSYNQVWILLYLY